MKHMWIRSKLHNILKQEKKKRNGVKLYIILEELAMAGYEKLYAPTIASCATQSATPNTKE